MCMQVTARYSQTHVPDGTSEPLRSHTGGCTFVQIFATRGGEILQFVTATSINPREFPWISRTHLGCLRDVLSQSVTQNEASGSRFVPVEDTYVSESLYLLIELPIYTLQSDFIKWANRKHYVCLRSSL